MRVLITGGAGYLGAHLADRFQQDGVPVRLFDRADCPTWAREADIEYVRGDVRDPEMVKVALEGVASVVHTAFASPRQSAQEIQSVNAQGTRNLCAASLACGVRRFILVSSTIVRKPRRVHPLLVDSPLTRLDRYRAARVEAEAIVGEYGDRGLPVAVVWPKTFLGPGRVSAFAILFDWVRQGQPVLVLGSGRNRYQLLDIRDMADGIRLLEASDATGRFCFGAHEFRTVREDLQAFLDHARTGARLRHIPEWVARAAVRGMELASMIPLSEWHSTSSRGEDSVVDTARAERELGWLPRRSNAQALAEAYDWYITTLKAGDTARTTHPVPMGHRLLQGVHRLLWR
jgi:nucleoside-diphosphate-sugar epimerase